MEECEIHAGNIQRFYCSQHYDLFCVDCGTDTYLDCRDVTFLSEISETSKSMLAHLKRQNEGFQSLIEDSVRCIDGTEQKKEETLQYIEQVRSESNRFIDNLKQDVNTRYTQFQSDIRRQIGVYEENVKSIELSLSALNVHIQLGKECKDIQHVSKVPEKTDDSSLILSTTAHNHWSIAKEQHVTSPKKIELLKYSEKRLRDNFALTETSSQTRMVEVSCTSTQTKDVLCRDLRTDCSDLTVLQSASSQTDLYQTSDIGVNTFTLHYPEKTILSDVQVPVDVEGEGRCAATSCAVVQNGRVVIADRYNRCVKLVKVPDMIQSGDNAGTEAGHQQTGTGRGSVLFKLKLSCTPGDVTAISQDHVAVTLPYGRQVQILKVDQHKLTCVRNISTNVNYCGITYDRGIFVMVKIDRRHKRLTVDTLQGEKVSVVKVLQYNPVDDDDRSRLGYECYVTAAEDGTVYVTNYNDDTVTRLTLTREVLGQYKFQGLREPLGICVHPTDGSVYICYRESDCILRMSPDGREIQRFKVSSPWSVCVTGDNRMVVGRRYQKDMKILFLS